MAVFWFVAGACVGGAAVALVLRSQTRAWWQWVLIAAFAAWAVFAGALALYTFAEGNPKGGWILLVAGLVITLGLFAGLRAALRAGAPRSLPRGAAS